ncbi:MAG: hypothetical protein ACI9FB_003479 [Candidatus Azotimanducaceae bacterium]|jgi:hypothetical protein
MLWLTKFVHITKSIKNRSIDCDDIMAAKKITLLSATILFFRKNILLSNKKSSRWSSSLIHKNHDYNFLLSL